MHGSLKALDALSFAPGPIVCLVEISGKVQLGNDKLVGERRHVLHMANAEKVLFEFACDEAERALLKRQAEGYEFSPASFEVIEARRRWLRGEISDSKLAAARRAASNTAWGAAGGAAASAARRGSWRGSSGGSFVVPRGVLRGVPRGGHKTQG